MSSTEVERDLTIPQHLADRLRHRGVDCGFGIVGDYALRLFADLEGVGFPLLVKAVAGGGGKPGIALGSANSSRRWPAAVDEALGRADELLGWAGAQVNEVSRPFSARLG